MRCFKREPRKNVTEKYEYCSAVPRTFVQDCNLRRRRYLNYKPFAQLVPEVQGKKRKQDHKTLKNVIFFAVILNNKPPSQVLEQVSRNKRLFRFLLFHESTVYCEEISLVRLNILIQPSTNFLCVFSQPLSLIGEIENSDVN